MDMEQIHSKAERIRDVIRYVQKFKNAAIVIHIDDSVIDSPLFSGHISDICRLHESGLRIIIVPAARKRINEILTSYNIPWHFVDGSRITGDTAIPLIKMAAFDVSNKVMTSLAAEKRTAVIGNWVRARGKGVLNGIDLTTSGEIDKIQIESIETILSDGFIPIFPCIGWSAAGKPYNISSKLLAAAVATHIKADKLFFLTESTTISAESFVIPAQINLSEGCLPALNLNELYDFIAANEAKAESAVDDETIKSETLSLLRLAIRVCRSGVSRVHILNGSIDGTILCEIFSDLGSGTMIYEDSYGSIRDMEVSDITPVLTLIRPFVEKGILINRTAEELSDQIDDYIVYELDGGIKACAALHLYSDGQAEIAAVAVDPTCAQIGIGPKLIDFLFDRAKDRGISSVFVLTTQTADWFEQQGFVLSDVSTLPEKRKQKWSPSRGSKVLRRKLR